MRLRSALGHSTAAELLFFMSGDHVFGPTLFAGGGGGEQGAKKSEVTFPVTYLGWSIRRKSSKMKAFFKLFLQGLKVFTKEKLNWK